MGDHPPVTDWATDFDHTDDAWAADPYPIWDELRETCPVAHTERYGGAWLPTRYEDIAAIAYDTERFTSRSVVMSEFRPPLELAPAGIAPPISSDPPFHQGARRLLLPVFSPQAIDKLEPSTRAYCEELIEAMRGRDVVDAAVDYAQHIPVRVIAEHARLSRRRTPTSSAASSTTCSRASTCPSSSGPRGCMALFEYLRATSTTTSPTRATTSSRTCWTVELDGEKLDPLPGGPHHRACCSSPASTRRGAPSARRSGTWPRHPPDRERLVAEPELLPARDGGVPAGLRAGDHGPPRARGHGLERLSR